MNEPMLSAAEIAEIEAEIARYPRRQAASIDALKIAQRRRGWISDEILADLASLLGMSPAELDNVATFYNLIYRKPTGRHVVLLSDSVTCWILGCDALRARLRARLGVDFGGTTADGRFTLLPIACLGVCEKAPALMVGEELFTEVSEEKIDGILGRFRENDTLEAR
jgi:NADH-quinone oxidoreductase subunit E